MDSQYFNGIIGHRAIKEHLLRLLAQDRLPHAMIFAGPSGVGKTRLAVALASAMVGRGLFSQWEAQQKEEWPILAEGEDAYYLGPIGSMLRVDQFRQLQSRLMLQGKGNSRRVCIIDHVETMNTEFANRMLKILEEPPTGVYFILITDQPAKLLPTILSRCAKFMIEPVTDDEMEQGLMTLYGGVPGDYSRAISMSSGIVSTALSYVQGGGAEDMDQALSFLQIVTTHACPYAKWLSLSGSMTDEQSADILQALGLVLRDMLVLRSGADISLLRLVQYKDEMKKLLPHWTDAGLFAMVQLVEEGIEAITRHVNIRLVWDYVTIQSIQHKGGV